jgi:hypothetical protein
MTDIALLETFRQDAPLAVEVRLPKAVLHALNCCNGISNYRYLK